MVSPPDTPELSRPVKVKGLPGEPVRVEADAAERAALARRFGLPGIDRLHTDVDLETRATAIRATGTLNADIRQSCAISGEDFPARVEERIDLRFVTEASFGVGQDDGSPAEIELEADDCDEIEYRGDTIDVGEAVAQTLGLAIDPYAEGPGADEARKRAGIVAEDEQAGPLADALAQLKKG